MTTNNQSAWYHAVWRNVRPSQFTVEDQATLRRYLNVLLPTVAVLLALRAVAGFVQNDFVVALTEALILALALIVIGLWLWARRGHVRFAATAFLILAFLSMVFLASQSTGVFDSTFTALAVVIALAGLLSGSRTVIVAAAAAILAGWWLAGQQAATSLTLAAGASLLYARDMTIVFILLSVVVYLIIASLNQAVQRAHADEMHLRQQNAELRQLQETLEERVSKRTFQLRTAAEVGRTASSLLEPDQLLSDIVNLIADRFGYYYAAIFTLDRTGSYLVLREATGEAGRTLKERGHRLRLSMDSMVGYAALRREPRVAQNAREDMVRFANPLLPDTRAEVALPLLVGDDVVGALDVQSSELDAFDEATLTALQAMASQIAVALQNAQSFQSLQKTVDYTQRQYQLSRTIFLAKTPNEAYLALGHVFAMFADVDRIQLMRVIERDVNHEPALYELAIEWDVLSGAQMDTGLTYTAAETTLAPLVQLNETVVIRDASDAHLPSATRERLMQVNAQAIILAPLIIGPDYSGFVAAIAEQPREFTDNEVRLLKATAEQLGVVLTNLQLTTEMRTTLERVALLNRRLSGEAWDVYRAGRTLDRVESGRLEMLTPDNQLQVPIVVRGETIGVFNVADNELDRSWQTDELSMLQTIANEVALAIDNARLIEQTQRTAQREKEVSAAADQIHRSMNLETILNTALNEIVRITGVEDVAIQFGAASGNGQAAAHSQMTDAAAREME